MPHAARQELQPYPSFRCLANPASSTAGYTPTDPVPSDRLADPSADRPHSPQAPPTPPDSSTASAAPPSESKPSHSVPSSAPASAPSPERRSTRPSASHPSEQRLNFRPPPPYRRYSSPARPTPP